MDNILDLVDNGCFVDFSSEDDSIFELNDEEIDAAEHFWMCFENGIPFYWNYDISSHLP